MLGAIPADSNCLLVTCGDNNGAINYYLRQLGGKWHWADLEREGLEEMEALLGDKVLLSQYNRIPFPDRHFNYLVAIDVHEHLEHPEVFTQEMRRITRDHGRIIITVPEGDPKKFVNKMKKILGMTKEAYGHTRDGYSVDALRQLMQSANIQPGRHTSFSRLFTELVELGINFLYVKVLAKKSKADVAEGTIAPQTQAQLKSVEKSYRLYSLVYPFFWLFSQLDKLLFFTSGYVVMVEGHKSTDDLY